MEENLVWVFALIAALGMAAQWLAWRLQAPAVVLLTLVGIVAGPVLGWIRPTHDFGVLLHPIIKLGVAVILLEGGLNLRFHELKLAAVGVRRLVTAGTTLSFAFGSLAARFVGGFSWPTALVFGAVIVVTGPTVIIPMLRHARLHKRPASYLKWEGIINDPIGALLAFLLYEYFVTARGAPLHDLLSHMGGGLLSAGVLGVGGAYLLGTVYRRGYVPEYLKGPGTLGAALVVYVLGNLALRESGLLAVTLMGIVLGNMQLPSIEEIRRTKEYVGIMVVSAVFILLTADLDPQILLRLDPRSLALLLVLLFVVRPASVFLSAVGSDMPLKEQALIAWIAPRGIVAAAIAGIFGPGLQEQGYAGAELFLPLVFSLILVTVVLHGFSIDWMARKLGLSAAARNGVLIVGASSWTAELGRVLKEMKIPVMIADTSWHRLRPARQAGIPAFYGEILSERSEETLEFYEAGSLFAATDNDAYNSLVCKSFAADFGQTRVFQLPDLGPEEIESRRLSRTFRGLIAPSEKALYEELLANWYRGWTFQKTPITDVFTYEHFLANSAPDIIPVVLVKESGDIQFNSSEQPIKPKAGDVVIWFGAKPEKTRTREDQGDPPKA